jgi:hypothetical protein
MAEHRLRESIWRIEQRLAALGAVSGMAQPELERLQCELAETTTSRVRLTLDFEARMKDFERRFAQEQGPRLAARGKDFGRRMEAMDRNIERQLDKRRAHSVSPPVVPQPPRLPSAPLPSAL